MLWWELKNWRARIICSQCLRDSVTALSVRTLSFRALHHLTLNKAKVIKKLFKGSIVLLSLVLHYFIILSHKLIMIVEARVMLLVINWRLLLWKHGAIIREIAIWAETNGPSEGALVRVLQYNLLHTLLSKVCHDSRLTINNLCSHKFIFDVCFLSLYTLLRQQG